jgi:hypothetical protein
MMDPRKGRGNVPVPIWYAPQSSGEADIEGRVMNGNGSGNKMENNEPLGNKESNEDAIQNAVG